MGDYIHMGIGAENHDFLLQLFPQGAAVFDDPVLHHRHHHRGLKESERAIRRQQSGRPANPGRAEIRHHLIDPYLAAQGGGWRPGKQPQQ